MPDLYFLNEKTGKRYKILEFDREGGKVKLEGPAGIAFNETYNKERLQKLGYKLVQG